MELAPFASEHELTALVSGFEDRTLTHEEWNHRAHLAVASCYVHTDADSAIDYMRRGIKRLNKVHGVEDTPEGGYHETLTQGWVGVIRGLLKEQPQRLRLEFVNEVLSRLGDKKYLLKHYTRDRIMSIEARLGWVEPDLEPLPA